MHTSRDVLSIFELFTDCPILSHFCSIYDKEHNQIDKDYEYYLQQKEKEIEKLKQQINELRSAMQFPPLTEKPKDFESSMHEAVKQGKLDSVRWLVEKENYDLNQKVFSDDYAIHTAATFNQLPIVQYLIEQQNVDVNKKGWKGRSPLHYACENGLVPIINYLLSKGADIEARDDEQRTPLHDASYTSSSSPEVVKLLLSKGADKDAKTRYGETPYSLAIRPEIKDLLK